MPSDPSDATTITAIGRQFVEVSWRTWWDFVGITVAGPGTEVVGHGELSDSGDRPAAARLFDQWRARLVGQSVPAALELLAEAAAELAARPERERWLPLTVIGGLETALCDASARLQGVSLAEWFGATGPPEPTALYANINRAVRERTPDTVARVADAAVRDGFTAVKIAPFDSLTERSDRAAYGVALARAAREAIGPDVALMVDCHRHLTRTELLDVAADLAALDLRWLEDALEVTDLDGLRAVKDAVGAPLAGGEQAASPDHLRPALEAGLLDVVLPDIKHAGGPRRASDIATVCAGFGVEVAMHNPSGPIATVASAHVQAGATTGRILEYAYGEIANRGTVLEPSERITGGTLHPHAGPGLGHRLAALDSTWQPQPDAPSLGASARASVEPSP